MKTTDVISWSLEVGETLWVLKDIVCLWFSLRFSLNPPSNGRFFVGTFTQNTWHVSTSKMIYDQLRPEMIEPIVHWHGFRRLTRTRTIQSSTKRSWTQSEPLNEDASFDFCCGEFQVWLGYTLNNLFFCPFFQWLNADSTYYPDNTRYEVPNFISKEASSVNAGSFGGCWVVTLRGSQQDFCGKRGGVKRRNTF